MVVNGNSSIDPTKGEYLLLVDYGVEGFTIVNQFHELQEALLGCMQNLTGSPITLVRLVTIGVTQQGQGNEDTVDSTLGISPETARMILVVKSGKPTCAKCNGTGNQMLFGYKQCTRCDGTGVEPKGKI